MTAGRAFHTDSRTWSNFQPNELVKLCGVPMGRWPVYVVKELLDNAVAALEEHALRVPMIRVTVTKDYVEVMDNGPGISDVVLEKVLDFERFGGSNRHHKLPTRGAQGNAIMTIVGIASAWAPDRSIEVSRPSGPRVALDVKLDKVLQEVKVETITVGEPGPSAIRVPWPVEVPWKRGGSSFEDVVSTIRDFSWMNPHVQFMMTDSTGKSTATRSVLMEPGATAAMRGSFSCGAASWFTRDEFYERMAADVRARPDIMMSDWCKEFAFSKVGPAVLSLSGEPDGTLSAKVTVDSGHKVSSFLQGLVLGCSNLKLAENPQFVPLGKDRMAGFLTSERGSDRDCDAQYHSLTGSFGDGDTKVPFLVEVCLQQMPDRVRYSPEPTLAMNRTVLYGSPSFRRKDGFQWREKVRGNWHGLDGDLGALARAYQIDHGKTPAAILVHVTCPSPGYAGYGKQQFDTSWLAGPLSQCFERVTLEVRRQRAGEARRKNANRPKRDTIREEMFRLVPGVLDEVTDSGKYEPLIRQFYYSFRKEWYTQDDRELHYGTFCAYVDEYERSIGRLVCLRDPRGTLYEPHSNKVVRLGTSDVRDYKPKKWEGHTIIFVEKENLASQMRAMNIHKRWDAIIVGSKGFAVEAIREVLQKYRRLLGDLVKIVVLHDADPAGYMIGYDLATNLPRFGDTVDVQVIDVGLTIRDAVTMGLQDEPFDLSKQVWSMITKTMMTKTLKDPDGTTRPLLEPEARDSFVPSIWQGAEYPSWADKPRGRRVELNAMPPREFEAWVERNLEIHGCRKVRPPDEVVSEQMVNARTNAITNQTGELFMRLMGQEVVDEVLREIGVPSYDLDSVLESRPEQHWHYLVTRAAQSGQDIGQAVERVMKRRFPQMFGGG